MLPPDPGNQVTDRPGAEKGVGKGEGEGPPRSALLGAPGTPPASSRPRTCSDQGKGATPFWISRLVRFPQGPSLPWLSPTFQQVLGRQPRPRTFLLGTVLGLGKLKGSEETLGLSFKLSSQKPPLTACY